MSLSRQFHADKSLNPKKIKHIAFINHTVESCGVYQYGKRLGSILETGKITKFTYHEIASLDQYYELCKQPHIDAFIYNYHPSTMLWLAGSTIQRKVPNIGLHHEGVVSELFEHSLRIDCGEDVDSIPRPLFNRPYKPQPDTRIPIIGSFGFGFENKGFARLIQYVNDQFDEAIIRLNITFPFFGDPAGNISKRIVHHCNSVPRKDGIKLVITHDFMDNESLLSWLEENTINIFMYDPLHGRGCASTIDYALSVNRPIGISDSYMFRHIYSDKISVLKTPIKDIITHGLEHLNVIKEKWSPEKLIDKLEYFLHQKVFIEITHTKKMINNTVLDDTYRSLLAADEEELFTLVPAMMNRKIKRANVQQAFAFRYIKDHFTKDTKMICAGSYEDTCCAGLKALGFDIVEVDPMFNSDLHTYCVTNGYPQFECVFSVSVIEHVPEDDEFVDDMCKLLKPGGTAVLTCDFNDSYVPEMRIPGPDCRLYTKNDLLVRFKDILERNDCYIDGEVDYDATPDFVFDGVLYSFATLVFKKKE